MNHLLFAFWFLQELRKKKNEIESEEEKKMEDAKWKANRIVTMATINIQMVAMDSSVFSSRVLFPAEIWSNLKSSQKSIMFWGNVIKKEHNYLSLIPNYFVGLEFEEPSRKTEFEVENKVPWSLNPDTCWLFNN